jgi:hypothetical protein
MTYQRDVSGGRFIKAEEINPLRALIPHTLWDSEQADGASPPAYTSGQGYMVFDDDGGMTLTSPDFDGDGVYTDEDFPTDNSGWIASSVTLWLGEYLRKDGDDFVLEPALCGAALEHTDDSEVKCEISVNSLIAVPDHKERFEMKGYSFGGVPIGGEQGVVLVRNSGSAFNTPTPISDAPADNDDIICVEIDETALGSSGLIDAVTDAPSDFFSFDNFASRDATATVTNGSAVLTNVSVNAIRFFSVGDAVGGEDLLGYLPSTTIVSIDSESQITVADAATGDASDVPIVRNETPIRFNCPDMDEGETRLIPLYVVSKLPPEDLEGLAIYALTIKATRGAYSRSFKVELRN